jgi:uridine phosphorylase
MEASALIQAAALNGFENIAAVKVVSDNADSDAPDDFSDIKGCEKRIRDIVIEYLSGIDK